MDLIKQMIQNRIAQGITTNAPPATSIRAMQKTKSLRQRRQDIIDNKPKPKIVLQYFEDVIQQNLESSDDEV